MTGGASSSLPDHMPVATTTYMGRHGITRVNSCYDTPLLGRLKVLVLWGRVRVRSFPDRLSAVCWLVSRELDRPPATRPGGGS